MPQLSDKRKAQIKAVEDRIAKIKLVGPVYGLGKGLSITLKHMVRHAITQQYPHEKPDLPPRTRGIIALKEENCTVCMLCSRECPDWCIYIDSHKDVMPPKTPGARARTRNVLDRFAIDFALCMYCGICVEVCPFDALFWSPDFEYSTDDMLVLTHEMARLNESMALVPPPPPLEDGAEQPKEFDLEPKVYEMAGAAVASAPAPAADTGSVQLEDAPVTSASETAAEAAPEAQAAAPAPAAEPKHDVGPPEIDQEAFDQAIAAGKSEREARAMAKKAWILKKRKELG
jgi:NADH-quinone oxidoreductase subunit I